MLLTVFAYFFISMYLILFKYHIILVFFEVVHWEGDISRTFRLQISLLVYITETLRYFIHSLMRITNSLWLVLCTRPYLDITATRKM